MMLEIKQFVTIIYGLILCSCWTDANVIFDNRALDSIGTMCSTNLSISDLAIDFFEVNYWPNEKQKENVQGTANPKAQSEKFQTEKIVLISIRVKNHRKIERQTIIADNGPEHCMLQMNLSLVQNRLILDSASCDPNSIRELVMRHLSQGGIKSVHNITKEFFDILNEFKFYDITVLKRLIGCNESEPVLVNKSQSEPSLVFKNQPEPSLVFKNQSESNLAYKNQSEPVLAYKNQSEPNQLPVKRFELNTNRTEPSSSSDNSTANQPQPQKRIRRHRKYHHHNHHHHHESDHQSNHQSNQHQSNHPKHNVSRRMVSGGQSSTSTMVDTTDGANTAVSIETSSNNSDRPNINSTNVEKLPPPKPKQSPYRISMRWPLFGDLNKKKKKGEIEPKGLTTAQIVGIVMGSIGLLAFIMLMYCFYCKQSKGIQECQQIVGACGIGYDSQATGVAASNSSANSARARSPSRKMTGSSLKKMFPNASNTKPIDNNSNSILETSLQKYS